MKGRFLKKTINSGELYRAPFALVGCSGLGFIMLVSQKLLVLRNENDSETSVVKCMNAIILLHL